MDPSLLDKLAVTRLLEEALLAGLRDQAVEVEVEEAAAAIVVAVEVDSSKKDSEVWSVML